MRAQPLRLIADLLAATADAHTPRALVRAIASSLSAHIDLIRLELASPRIAAIASAGAFLVDEAPPATAGGLAVAGMTLWVRGPRPAVLDDDAFVAALGQVVAAARRHLDVVQRVAAGSRRTLRENRDLREDVDRLERRPAIVARSPAMRAALARAELVARHPTTVLLTGESGTGKEVLAREIHRLSPRAHRPMLHLNCGALPEALVESELFGHERGAFTGADRARAGVFERAHRGTLLLDEVGELPPAAQVKLLRVLQERQVQRLGGAAPIDVDVRLIAATHRPLAAMVESGAFREDLYYRLDVFSLAVPALRERRGDLAPLVAALVDDLAARLEMPRPPIPRSVLARLDAHDWPGNVRELGNVLEAAMILGRGVSLELPDDLRRAVGRRAASPALDDTIRGAIEDALRATRGKVYGVDGAAARLGVPPATLQGKMRKLGIQRRAFARA